MKKSTILIALFATSLGIMTGCNKTNDDKIELTIGFWPEETETRDVAMYNVWKEKFETDNPEYKIVPAQYTYDTNTILTKYTSKTLPVVFQTWFTEPNNLRSKKIIRSIDKQIKDLKWDTYMDEGMKESLVFDNEIYGIPRDGYGLGLLINMKTLYDNGLINKDENGKYLLYNEDNTPAYPTTFEEIYELGVKLSEYDETKTILICSDNQNGGWQFSNFAWNYGASLQHVDSDGKVISTLDCNEAVNALSWIQKMKNEGLLLDSTTVLYNDWYDSIDSKVAMAVVGSDVLHLASTVGKVNMDDLAFVPMPTGDGIHKYSLYGGTPYVFSSRATDKQVEGVLKFFEYIGRSPIISDISKEAMEEGNKVAQNKNQPIIPKIKPWINSDYVKYATELENKYVSVNMDYYSEFFQNIENNKHSEVPYEAQQMYEYLDDAIQSVFANSETVNVKSLLTTANSKMQDYLNKKVNK